MMNLSEIVKRVRTVAVALDNVEVKGRTNHDIILGSIQSLERVAAQLEQGMREMNAPATQPEPGVTVELVPEEEKPAE